MFSALPQCADRDTKWTFSVETFTSTKSTHWKNSNILATRPKLHNSILKDSEGGRLTSMNILNDPIGKRTRDLPTCSAVPQPTATARAPFKHCTSKIKKTIPPIDYFSHLYVKHMFPVCGDFNASSNLAGPLRKLSKK